MKLYILINLIYLHEDWGYKYIDNAHGGICRGQRGNFSVTGLVPILQHNFFLSGGI